MFCIVNCNAPVFDLNSFKWSPAVLLAKTFTHVALQVTTHQCTYFSLVGSNICNEGAQEAEMVYPSSQTQPCSFLSLLHHLSLCTWLRLGEYSRFAHSAISLSKNKTPVGSCGGTGLLHLKQWAHNCFPNSVFKKDLTSDLKWGNFAPKRAIEVKFCEQL